MERPMQKLNDLSRSLTALEPNGTLIAVIEMSLSSWLVAGIVPGVERQPLKKLAVDESTLLKLLHRWREEAEKAGRRIERIAVAFEAGRDGFWMARWLKVRGIEAYVIHASSVAVSREHRRAKTDRLDMERRRLVNNQIRQIEEERLKRIEQAPCDGPHVMVRLLARVMGVGIETADMLVHEVLSRNMRDRRAVARYAGLTGSPDESGRKRREKGLARSGNTRVRRGMIQLAWRFPFHPKENRLTKWV